MNENWILALKATRAFSRQRVHFSTMLFSLYSYIRVCISYMQYEYIYNSIWIEVEYWRRFYDVYSTIYLVIDITSYRYIQL
jgi:hypothetical protein